jgi:hypothetical protein
MRDEKTAPTHLYRLHDTAFVRVWSDALILSQVRRCLLDEITSLVEADPIPFRIAYCLTNAKVIRSSSMAVFSGAFEVLNRFLLEFRHCFKSVRFTYMIDGKRGLTCSYVGQKLVDRFTAGYSVGALIFQEDFRESLHLHDGLDTHAL